MRKKINWKKGNGEFVGFAVISVIISVLIITIAAFIQLSLSVSSISKSATAVSRAASVCTSIEDARDQAQRVAENTLTSDNISQITTNIDFVGGTNKWESGGYIVVTVRAHVKTIEPYFTSGFREKKILITIEGLNGSTIIIPSQYGNGGFTITEYDSFYGRWTAGTEQKKVAEYWYSHGATFTDHIASINGYYLIACSPKFGMVGDKVRFTLSDGTEIDCIVADSKRNTILEGSNEWGHNMGQNIIEFEVESSYYQANGNPGSSVWKPEWVGKRVAKCTNYGVYPAFK